MGPGPKRGDLVMLGELDAARVEGVSRSALRAFVPKGHDHPPVSYDKIYIAS